MYLSLRPSIDYSMAQQIILLFYSGKKTSKSFMHKAKILNEKGSIFLQRMPILCVPKQIKKYYMQSSKF